jgi:hypothetical protein
MIAKVATIVDYYDCLEIVEIFAGIWVDALAESQPSTYGKDTILWLLVSWVFQRQDIFEKMAGLALRHSERLITVQGVPIPHVILSMFYNFLLCFLFFLLTILPERIDKERQNALAEIFSSLYKLLDTMPGIRMLLRMLKHALGFLDEGTEQARHSEATNKEAL